ncbi:MAG: SDR family NAD(P)-dependent oxidoreductase [Anaerolineales bacterium]|nr:SDR family NAD(P)-dependent oxidoreductase [Anaerolineales bacterium]
MDQSPVVIITGASSGIGEATARLLGAHGYRLVLAARRQERLERLAEEIRGADGQAVGLATDVTRLEDIQRLVEHTMERFGQVDVLFNNAGFGRLDWLEHLDPVRDVARQVHVDLLGLIHTTQAVLPYMIARRNGHIINVASLAGHIAVPTYSVYAASKFGVRGFTDALRREMGVWGVHVSGVYPGSVATEFELHTGARRKTGLRTPGWLRLSAEQVAGEILRLIRRPRRQVVLPRVMLLAVWLNALAPGVVDLAVRKGFVERERS